MSLGLFVPVYSFEDITRNFEQLDLVLGSVATHSLTEFLQLATAGDVHVSYGADTIAYAGGSQFSSVDTSIAHGLGTSVFYVALCDTSGQHLGFGAHNGTGITFDVYSWAPMAAPGAGSYGFTWIAIG